MKNYKKKEEIFKKFYEQCSSTLKQFETKRKMALSKLFVFEPLLLVLFVISINFYNSSYIAFICVLLAGITAFMYPICTCVNFKVDLKYELMPKITSILSKNLRAGCSIGESELRESTLFGHFNKIDTDDSFCGIYNNVNFKFSEIELRCKGSKTDFTSFKGVVIEFPANKNIQAKTVVATTKDINVRNKIPVSMRLYIIIVWLMPLIVN